jgi:tetratricopeptide (TPR) repeat protein
MTSDAERASLHDGGDWQQIAPHLPDPATASADALETAGDVLRARRFPEDALDFYGYAMARGGNVSKLLNKMGVVRLELRQYDLAEQMFTRVVRADKRNAQAWNNLAATDFMMHHFGMAVANYRKAVSLDRGNAVYHSNLGLVYFEQKNNEDARRQFKIALQLDPNVMHNRDQGGQSAHVLASTDYPELCFEFARLAAKSGRLADMRLWLARASEGGYDIQEEMRSDVVMSGYLKDPEVAVLISNAREMRRRKVAVSKPVPSLGPAMPAHFN